MSSCEIWAFNSYQGPTTLTAKWMWVSQQLCCKNNVSYKVWPWAEIARELNLRPALYWQFLIKVESTNGISGMEQSRTKTYARTIRKASMWCQAYCALLQSAKCILLQEQAIQQILFTMQRKAAERKPHSQCNNSAKEISAPCQKGINSLWIWENKLTLQFN